MSTGAHCLVPPVHLSEDDALGHMQGSSSLCRGGDSAGYERGSRFQRKSKLLHCLRGLFHNENGAWITQWTWRGRATMRVEKHKPGPQQGTSLLDLQDVQPCQNPCSPNTYLARYLNSSQTCARVLSELGLVTKSAFLVWFLMLHLAGLNVGSSRFPSCRATASVRLPLSHPNTPIRTRSPRGTQITITKFAYQMGHG